MSSVVKLDLYEWLPGWGESQVLTRSVSGDFLVDVTYDDEDGKEETRSLVFESACFFSVGSFPGVEGIRFEFEYNFEIGKVLEIRSSGLANAWKKYWEDSSFGRECEHFLVFFGSANTVIHVVASDVTVR